MNKTAQIVESIRGAYRKVYRGDDFIPLHEPSFKGNELKYVSDCVTSGWVSSVGEYVTKFQKEFAKYAGAAFATPTASGTAALHLALRCVGVGEGDEVLCPEVTFVATAAAITYSGADPVFMDVDEDTLGLSPRALQAFIDEHTEPGPEGTPINRRTRKRVAAVMPMHNVGIPARIKEIAQICARHNIALVEDAAESLGSKVDGKMTGTFGRCGVFSFNGNKIMTTGGGGMLVTDDEAIHKKAQHLSTTAKVPHPYAYIHDDIGYNYRLPNLNAALGLAQLERLDEMLLAKSRQFEAIKRDLDTSLMKVIEPKNDTWNHWFVLVRVDGEELGPIISGLAEAKIMARPLWSRISEMKPYKKYLATPSPVSARLASSVLCLPNGVAKASR